MAVENQIPHSAKTILYGSHIGAEIYNQRNKNFDLVTPDLGVFTILNEIAEYANRADSHIAFETETERGFGNALLREFRELAGVDDTLPGVISIGVNTDHAESGTHIYTVNFVPTLDGMAVAAPRRIIEAQASLDASSKSTPYEGQITIGRRNRENRSQFVYSKSQTHNFNMTARAISNFIFGGNEDLMKTDNLSPSNNIDTFSLANLD